MFCQICQIPHVIFESTSTTPSNFASIFIAIKHSSSVIFQLTHYILSSKEPIREQIFLDFQVLESKFVKFLKRQFNSSLNFALFFIAMTHNSSVNFKLINFLFWTKEFHQSPNFDTFNCSGENFPIFSCQFFFKFCITLQCHER